MISMLRALRRFSLVLVLAILGPVVAAARELPSPKEPWTELRAADFTLYSNAGEHKAREIGEDFERLRDALTQLFPGQVLSSPVPTSIFVFKDFFSFQPYVRSYDPQVVDKGGYFLGRPLGNYVAISADQQGQERELIYHEYIHYLLRSNAATLPLWLHEGLAEYYSTLEAGKGDAGVGLPPAQHAQWLRQHPLIPLAQVFAVDERSPEYNEWSRSGAFYAESWVLVHYLISGNPERRRQMGELLRLAQAGTPPERLVTAAFGDPTVLEAELRSYVKKYVFRPTRLPLRPEAKLAMTAQPMAWPDVLSRLGDLLGNLADDHLALAAEHFHAALAAKPDQATALAGLGQLAERADRPDEARSFYEQAAPLGLADPTVQYLLARSLLASPGADSLRRARAALQTAVALRPEFGEAWASLGYTDQAENLSAEAVTSLEAAHRLLPFRIEVAHNLALAYARTGQTQKAGELIERMLALGASAEEIESAREALIDEEQQRAQELIEQDRMAEAATLLEAASAKTASPARREAIAGQLEEIRRKQSFNVFVERYNRAMELETQGDVKGATALLEPLLATTLDPIQAERARALLDRLRQPQTKRGGVPH